MLHTTELYYFSPTGGTEKVGEYFCRKVSEITDKKDLQLKSRMNKKVSGDLVVAAVPVFGGRVPSVAADKLKKLNGNGKKAVTLVVFGNRSYGDALLELNDIMTSGGFKIVASGAFAAQHSMLPAVGKGRPDEQDIAEIQEFAEKVMDKVEHGICNKITVPGNVPYREKMLAAESPGCLFTCNCCGKCMETCPTSAVRIRGKKVITNPDKCILCMACVAGCPNHARFLSFRFQKNLWKMSGESQFIRMKNECFL